MRETERERKGGRGGEREREREREREKWGERRSKEKRVEQAKYTIDPFGDWLPRRQTSSP